MRIIITGNLGYIGSVLSETLADLGYEVWGIDTGYYCEHAFGISPNAPHGVARQLRLDVRDITAEHLTYCGAIIHLAALSNDPIGELNPHLTTAINHRASLRLAQTARTAGVKRFIFASSCSIYGAGGNTSLSEEAAFAPLTAYAHSKVDTERDVADLASDHFSPIFMRFATAFGFSPRLRCDIVVNNLTASAFTSGEVKLLSDGTAWRPLVHVRDIAQSCVSVLEQPQAVIHNQAFNIGSQAVNCQVRTIADMVATAVPRSTVTIAAGSTADQRNYQVNFGKAQKLLPDFRPDWTLERGIADLYAQFKRVGLSAADFNGRATIRIKQLRHLCDMQRLDTELRWCNHLDNNDQF